MGDWLVYAAVAPFAICCLIGFAAGVTTFLSWGAVILNIQPDPRRSWFYRASSLDIWFAPREALTEAGQRHWARAWKAAAVFLVSIIFGLGYMALLEVLRS